MALAYEKCKEDLRRRRANTTRSSLDRMCLQLDLIRGQRPERLIDYIVLLTKYADSAIVPGFFVKPVLDYPRLVSSLLVDGL